MVIEALVIGPKRGWVRRAPYLCTMVALLFIFPYLSTAKPSLGVRIGIGAGRQVYGTMVAERPADTPAFFPRVLAADSIVFRLGVSVDLALTIDTGLLVYMPTISFGQLYHHGGKTTTVWGGRLDVQIGGFGWEKRGYVTGGIGTSSRILDEGTLRLISGDTLHVASDVRVFDLALRAGVGFQIVEYRRMNLAIELTYQGNYQLLGPTSFVDGRSTSRNDEWLQLRLKGGFSFWNKWNKTGPRATLVKNRRLPKP